MASTFEDDSQDRRIVLLGVYGAGKSPTANAILGRDAFKESTTRESEIKTGKVEDRNISIIDTPGFFNTQVTDEELQKQMMKSLNLSDPGPHVFLLIINMQNFEKDERNIVEKIEENFGVQALRFTMVLFIGREQITKRKWKLFMDSLKVQKLVNHCSGQYHVINSKNHTIPTQITKLLEKIDEIIKDNDGQHYRKVVTEQQLIPADVRIVMVGKTGVGKSATGNTIFGQKVFEEKLCSELVTKRCHQHQHIVENKIISVIDTPGLSDVEIKEGNLQNTIMKCVEMSVPGPHAFLMLIRLDVKFTEEEKITVKWIEDNFTADAARYTIILFTRGDQLDTSIEKFLTDNKQIKELVSKYKGGYHVFNNKDEENRTQVTELLKKIDRMVKENGGKHYTNEMYKEAVKRQREEDERRRLEEEENMRKKERFRNMNKAQKAALVTAGIVGSVVGGAAAVAGGAALAAVSLAVSPVSVLTAGGILTLELSEKEKEKQKKRSRNEEL